MTNYSRLLVIAGFSVVAASAQKISEMQKAVEEFQTQTRNLGLRADSPATARNNASKTARYHGRIFENLRNDLFDAVPHEIKQRGSNKSLLRRNQFGFNAGGPLIIPKLYDGSRSTFFSVSYEGVRERISRSYLRTVPIVAERTGDFSQTVDSAGQALVVYDPATTRRNPDSDPAQPVTSDNLQYLRDPFPGNRMPQTRLDPVAVKALQYLPVPNANVGPFFRNNYFAVSPETNTANGMIFRLDHNVKNRHRIESSFAFSNGFAGSARVFPNIADANPSDRTFSSRRASVQYSLTASPRTLHTTEVEALSNTSKSEGEIFPAYRFGNSYAAMGRSNPLQKNVRNSFGLSHGVTARRGKHSLRLTGSYVHQQNHAFSAQFPAGSFRFGTGVTSLPGITNTGHSFASYLLGSAESAEVSVVTAPSYFRRNQGNLLARDSWEVQRGFTLTGSLNLEIATPRTEKYDRQSTVDLSLINPALVFAGTDEYGRGFQPVRVRLEPSMGMAWNPAGDAKTVVRASYGRSYQAIGLGGGQFGTQGFNAYPTWISANAQLEPAVTLSGGLPPLTYGLPNLRPDAVNNTIADVIDMTSRQPRIQTAGLSLEREVLESLVVTAGAYHHDGNNLLVGGATANLNGIPLDALEYRDQLNDEAFRKSLRPFPQYLGFDMNGQYPLGKYARDAAYLRLEKRTSGGLGLSAYYEFSKQLDDYSGPYGTQDSFNRDNEWALTAGSNPHKLTLSYVYELPIGAGRGLLAYNDWRRYMIEGWSISGMTSVSSGEPLALHPQFNNTGGVLGTLNVNVVPDVSPAVAEQGPEMWFNPAAFAQPADFTVGNASRTHPSLLGPGSQNHDLSLTKRFPLDADKALELSAVGFNFVNHANWNDPDIVIGPESAPNVNAGKIIGSRGGRVIQLGLRYSF